MNQVLKEKIQQLPALPESAIKLEAIYHDPNSTFDDMVKVLEIDPLLTADILKAANSPLYGFTREINSISQAVGLFGMGTIRGFALAMIVKKSFKLDLSPYGISNSQFSDLSKMQNALAITWYLRQKPRLMELLSPASFLIEIGKVLISQYLLEEGKDSIFKEKLKAGEGVKDLELEMCDTYTAAISADIFNHWKFDENLISLIRLASTPEDCLDESLCEAAKALHVIRIATGLNGVFTDETLASAKELIAKYELDLPSFEAAIEKMSA
ncbi:MAG: histidine kinase [Arcobacter sp.]|nr:MAG: histidine kinase [Arcobacter sp.]